MSLVKNEHLESEIIHRGSYNSSFIMVPDLKKKKRKISYPLISGNNKITIRENEGKMGAIEISKWKGKD